MLGQATIEEKYKENMKGKKEREKGMAWYIQNDEREETTTKNTLCRKTLIQILQRNQKL